MGRMSDLEFIETNDMKVQLVSYPTSKSCESSDSYKIKSQIINWYIMYYLY